MKDFKVYLKTPIYELFIGDKYYETIVSDTKHVRTYAKKASEFFNKTCTKKLVGYSFIYGKILLSDLVLNSKEDLKKLTPYVLDALLDLDAAALTPKEMEFVTAFKKSLKYTNTIK